MLANKQVNLDDSFEVLASASTQSLNSLSSSFYNKIDSNYHSFLSTDELRNASILSHSLASLSNDDDSWKASAIGIKCISYKPIGYVFLTRKIQDIHDSVDGKRKLEILYSYSKRYKRVRYPMFGSSINHCSFCDNITLDFDPDCSLFDLIMEVQIITQCPNETILKKKSKLSRMTKSGSTAAVKSSSSSSSSESENEGETTFVTSTYDIKYHTRDNRPNVYEVLKNVNINRRKNSFEDKNGKTKKKE